MTWPLPGWEYRKEFSINLGSGEVYDYQQRLVIGREAGEVDVTFDLNGRCAVDFRDLRFTADDGTTMLPYWIEEIYDGTLGKVAIVWVYFALVDVSGVYGYVYYLNAAATDASDGDETFLFFDDFSTTWNDPVKWTGDTASGFVTGGILTLASGTKKLYSPKISGDIALRARCKLGNGDTALIGLREWVAADDQVVAYHDGAATNHSAWKSGKDGASSTVWSDEEIPFGSFGAFDLIRIMDCATDKAQGIIDAVEAGTGSLTNVPTADLAAHIASGSAVAVEVEWILVRRYLTPDAIFGIGAEEWYAIVVPLLAGYLEMTAYGGTFVRTQSDMKGIRFTGVAGPDFNVSALSPEIVVGRARRPALCPIGLGGTMPAPTGPTGPTGPEV